LHPESRGYGPQERPLHPGYSQHAAMTPDKSLRHLL